MIDVCDVEARSRGAALGISCPGRRAIILDRILEAGGAEIERCRREDDIPAYHADRASHRAPGAHHAQALPVFIARSFRIISRQRRSQDGDRCGIFEYVPAADRLSPRVNRSLR